MSSPVCKVTVVCPAYEEEEVLPRFHAELGAVLDRLGPAYEVEILYVDDGSHDGTLDIIRRLAGVDRRVHYLSFSRNFGHQAALTAGLEHARGDAIITLDSDLQHPPAVIPTLLARWREGCDVVLTLREDNPHLGWFKRFSSRAFYWVMGWLSDTEMRSAASDYRLLSRRAVEALLRLREAHRFLRGMVHWVGFPTATVTFRPAARAGGVPKYTLRRMLALAVDALLSFSRLPLRLALLLGAALVGLGATETGRVVWLLGRGGEAFRWEIEAVLAAVLVVGGGTLGCLGIVGEYVGRIYDQVKARPLYLLKEVSADLAAGSVRAGLPGNRYGAAA